MPSSKKGPDGQGSEPDWRSYEKLAARFYEGRGFTVLARNWRAGRLEIDLIVQQENLIVFVEVKSASTKLFGHPAERVDEKKTINLTHAAQQFIAKMNVHDCDLRFDVVTFVNGRLEHFPGAFDAME